MSALILALLFALLVGSLSAQPAVRAVAISPDARYVAWISGADIWLTRIAKEFNQPKKIGIGTQLTWSPDSRRLAYVSDAGANNQQQVYTVAAEGGASVKIADLKGIPADFRWSPDGKTL
jgi:dipeptidyl aminopeptidase/acylaminoacyl peptidase